MRRRQPRCAGTRAEIDAAFAELAAGAKTGWVPALAPTLAIQSHPVCHPVPKHPLKHPFGA